MRNGKGLWDAGTVGQRGDQCIARDAAGHCGGFDCGAVGDRVASISKAPWHHELGRQLAKLAIGTGVVSPVSFFMLIGPEMARTGRLILMSPIVLGLAALVVYPKQTSEARGFEVLAPKDRDSDDSV